MAVDRTSLKNKLIDAIDRSGKSYETVGIQAMQSFLQKNGAGVSDVNPIIQEVYVFYQAKNVKKVAASKKSASDPESFENLVSYRTGKIIDYSSGSDTTPTLKERTPRKSVFSEIRKVSG